MLTAWSRFLVATGLARGRQAETPRHTAGSRMPLCTPCNDAVIRYDSEAASTNSSQTAEQAGNTESPCERGPTGPTHWAEGPTETCNCQAGARRSIQARRAACEHGDGGMSGARCVSVPSTCALRGWGTKTVQGPALPPIQLLYLRRPTTAYCPQRSAQTPTPEDPIAGTSRSRAQRLLCILAAVAAGTCRSWPTYEP